MNKRLASMLTAIALTVSPMAVSAVEFTPSAEYKDAPTGELVDVPEDYKDMGLELDITGVKDSDTLAPELQEELDKAVADLKDLNPSDLGLTDDYKVVDVFDVSAVDQAGNPVKIDGEVTFTVATDLADGTVFVVLHYDNGEFKVVPATIKDGVMTITAPSLSPFAILVEESAVTPAPDKPADETKKPETTTPSKDTNKTDTNKTDTKTPSTSGAETAVNTNTTIAGVGIVAGLAGVMLILKSRKGIAK